MAEEKEPIKFRDLDERCVWDIYLCAALQSPRIFSTSVDEVADQALRARRARS